MVYKSRCINFELWFIEEQTQDLARIYTTLESLIKKDIDKAVLDGCNTVVGLLLYEGFLYKNTEDFYRLLARIQDYGKSKGIIKFLLACGIVWDYQKELNDRHLEYEIIEFDYSANAMWESYKNYPLPSWNRSADKFLFLGGVPSRRNRIELLSEFYDSRLLTHDKALWSFFPPSSLSEDIKCRRLLSKYSDLKYKEFLAYADNKIDDKYSSAKEYSTASGVDWKQNNYLGTDFFKDPNYINSKIYTDTCISVIAEGHVYAPANDFRFLTEKTWRAVVNRHPFILADCDQRKQFAIDRGLNLFDEFYTEDYDSENKLSGVVRNVKHFIENKNKNAERINQIVNNNLSAFFTTINNNETQINTLHILYNIPMVELNTWFRQKSFDHLFRIPEYIS